MKFRPCIDIHNGRVKQIVGGTLRDTGQRAVENFVSIHDARHYARIYKNDGLKGGHIILLNSRESPYYAADLDLARAAMSEFFGGMMIGGGVTAKNAPALLDAGASHVIVTSYVFRDGRIHLENLRRIHSVVGRAHLVLDLSCRKRDGRYMIVTDRWQNFTDIEVSLEVLSELAPYCDEFLIHAVDVEGRAAGIDAGLVTLLAAWDGCPVTYAGGIGSMEDIRQLERLGNGRLDFTVGSALDLFGGTLAYDEIRKFR